MATEIKTYKRSRIGKLPVVLPAGVEVEISGQQLVVRGPKGVLPRTLPKEISVKKEGNSLLINPRSEDRRSRAMNGLARSLVFNMVEGVSKGYERVLEIIGVGYRAELKGNGRFLLFSLGYSHPILYEIPTGIKVEVSRDNKIKLSGIDKEAIGMTAAKIRSFRKPEPYKGKGIKYVEETILRKAGKAAAR